jgi:hypothetical protein
MNVLGTCTVLTAALFLVTGSASARPIAQEQQQQSRPKAPEPVTGELRALNPDTKTLVIKTTSDTEMKFSYSEQTEIVGADKGASGLATSAGATVTVTYDVHGTANVATKIEVKPKQ